jgi:hypothetical protein
MNLGAPSKWFVERCHALKEEYAVLEAYRQVQVARGIPPTQKDAQNYERIFDEIAWRHYQLAWGRGEWSREEPKVETSNG